MNSEINSYRDRLGFTHAFAADNCKVWVFWRKNFTFDIVSQSTQYVHLRGEHLYFSTPFHILAVYAKCSVQERRSLWEDISTIQTSFHHAPLMVGGYFNVVASLSECAGPSPQNLSAINEFAEFLCSVDLRELPVQGSQFTWSGVRQRGRLWRKLDRLLFNSQWLSVFPSSAVEVLNRATSDHNPLLFSYTVDTPKPSVFRFQNMWTTRSDFMAVVRNSWDVPAPGFGMYKFSVKLRRLKVVLKAWNRDVFGNFNRNIREAEERVTH